MPICHHQLPDGFYSDPHERQLFLFVYTDHEPLLFVPAPKWNGRLHGVDFRVVGYAGYENPWGGKIKGLSQNQMLKPLNMITWSDQIQWLACCLWKGSIPPTTPRIGRMRLIKIADEIQMLVAGQYADKAVNMGFDAISLMWNWYRSRNRFGIKRLGCKWLWNHGVTEIMQPCSIPMEA